MAPLFIVGMMSLGLGTTAIVTGALPVTHHRSLRGLAAKRMGWICWGFGLACMGGWLWAEVWYAFFRAGG